MRVFLSITGANLFLHKLGIISFLASKPGFQEIRPKNFLKSNGAFGSFISLKKRPASKPVIFNIEYLQHRLLEIAEVFKNDKLFFSFVDNDFLANFKVANSLFEQPQGYANLRITSGIQTFNSRSYIINLKVISLYNSLITDYDLFASSSPLIFESLVLTNFAPSIDAEEIKQNLNIHLFDSLINNSVIEKTQLHSPKMDSLLAYWVTDYLFKIENASSLSDSIKGFNKIVKNLEDFSFFKTLSPHLFTKILSALELKAFRLLPPVYQNPRFLQFLCNKNLISQFNNKIFLLNLAQIYQDYCSQNLSMDDSSLSYIELLTAQAQQQLLNSSIPLSRPAINKQKI